MVQFVRGNLLHAEVDVIVNTVNTVGVMGKGIALQIKQAYPENYEFYRQACERGEVQPGRMLVFPTGELQPRFIINFPTKRHWRAKSRLEDIELGLQELVRTLQQLDVHSVALPALGCGNGGLDWAKVAPLIQKYLSPLAENIRIWVYEPVEAKSPPARSGQQLPPAMAALVYLAKCYTDVEPELTAQDVQHLAYVLMSTGCWVGGRRKPDYRLGNKGLHSPLVDRLLKERLAAHYLQTCKGFRGKVLYTVSESSVTLAQQVLRRSSRTKRRLDRALTLLDGLESAFALWVLAHTLYVRATLLGQNKETGLEQISALLRVLTTPASVIHHAAHVVWDRVAEVEETFAGANVPRPSSHSLTD